MSELCFQCLHYPCDCNPAQPLPFDWRAAEQAMNAVLGPKTLSIDEGGLGAMIQKNGLVVALLQVVTGTDDTLAISFRASTPPITVALISTHLNKVYKIELDQCFEFDHNGDLITGPLARRFFAENSLLLLYGEKQKSKDSTNVRPKGAYLRHIN